MMNSVNLHTTIVSQHLIALTGFFISGHFNCIVFLLSHTRRVLSAPTWSFLPVLVPNISNLFGLCMCILCYQKSPLGNTIKKSSVRESMKYLGEGNLMQEGNMILQWLNELCALTPPPPHTITRESR